MTQNPPSQHPTEIIPTPPGQALAGRRAGVKAAALLFTDYVERKSANTLRRQRDDLALFGEYLLEERLKALKEKEQPQIPLEPLHLEIHAEAWRGITWETVEDFKLWQLGRGYSVGSINVRLATIRAYARLVARAGILDETEYRLIKDVQGYSRKDGVHIDEKRPTTRVGPKKAQAVSMTRDQAAQLITGQPDTPQGHRDAFLMSILLDHGLRVGEVALLRVENFDLKSGLLTFKRPKVNKTQTHTLTRRTLEAAQAYITEDSPTNGVVWRSSKWRAYKGDRQAVGTLGKQGMTVRAITKRVKELGERVGLTGLSAHDCRHYWATQAARNQTPLPDLQEAGGWNSPAMPMRYIQENTVANAGVKLGLD
jgi:integrase